MKPYITVEEVGYDGEYAVAVTDDDGETIGKVEYFSSEAHATARAHEMSRQTGYKFV